MFLNNNCKQIAAVVQKHCPAPPSSQLTVLKKLERKTCRTNGAFNQGALIIPNNGPMIDWRRLEKMLDANDPGEINDNEEDDDEIHQDEINEYLNKVQEQRAELRNNLRQQFEQLCSNSCKECLLQQKYPHHHHQQPKAKTTTNSQQKQQNLKM
jgi:hypothetical protein